MSSGSKLGHTRYQESYLGGRPGKSANIEQGGQELPVHDLGQAHISNLGCVIPGQQDVG